MARAYTVTKNARLPFSPRCALPSHEAYALGSVIKQSEEETGHPTRTDGLPFLAGNKVRESSISL